MFFLGQLTGLEATLFCQNKQHWRCYAMPEIPVSVFMQQQYKFLWALLLWVIWQCDGSCHTWDLVCYNWYLHRSMQWNRTLCPVTIWRVNRFPFKYTAGFHVGKLKQIKSKLRKNDETVFGSPCCALHPVLKTGDRGWKNRKLPMLVQCRLENWEILMFLNVNVGIFEVFQRTLLTLLLIWKGKHTKKVSSYQALLSSP